MKLEAEGQRAIVDPQTSEIHSTVSLLSPPDRTFLILSRSETSRIQAMINGPNRLVLEYRDGSPGQYFRSARDDFSTSEVGEILEAYRRGEDSWRSGNEWRPIDVSGRPDAWERLSTVSLFAGLLLAFDSAFAFRGADGDPIFGLEGMEVLSIAMVALMVTSIIDLRKFQTMDALEKVRTIGAIGVALLVLTIYSFERLRPR